MTRNNKTTKMDITTSRDKDVFHQTPPTPTLNQTADDPYKTLPLQRLTIGATIMVNEIDTGWHPVTILWFFGKDKSSFKYQRRNNTLGVNKKENQYTRSLHEQHRNKKGWDFQRSIDIEYETKEEKSPQEILKILGQNLESDQPDQDIEKEIKKIGAKTTQLPPVKETKEVKEEGQMANDSFTDQSEHVENKNFKNGKHQEKCDGSSDQKKTQMIPKRKETKTIASNQTTSCRSCHSGSSYELGVDTTQPLPLKPVEDARTLEAPKVASPVIERHIQEIKELLINTRTTPSVTSEAFDFANFSPDMVPNMGYLTKHVGRYQRNTCRNVIDKKCWNDDQHEERMERLKNRREQREQEKVGNRRETGFEQCERGNDQVNRDHINLDLNHTTLFPLFPVKTPEFEPELNYFGNLDHRGDYFYYDPIFEADLGNDLFMEVLADSGCILYCKSVMSNAQLEKIKRLSPTAIIKECPDNNQSKMRAAGQNTLTVTNTVTLRMTVANEEKATKEDGTRSNTPNMTRRVMEVDVCVVNELSREFILSNRDMAKYHECVIEQTTGHLTFRNYRKQGKRTGRIDVKHGKLVDELRIPLCPGAKRTVHSAPPLAAPRVAATAIRTREVLHLAPKSKVFYQIPIRNANLTIKVEHEKDKQKEEETARGGHFHGEQKEQVNRTGNLGQFDNPLLMTLDRTLEQSKVHQYMVSTSDPFGSWEEEEEPDTIAVTQPWTARTLVHSDEPHVLMLANHSNKTMTIPKGGTIAYVQRIEDIYEEGELGCVALHLGDLIQEEILNFITPA